MTATDNPGVCLHRWPFLAWLADPRVTHHICGRRIGHRLPHRCWACGLETNTK